mgnify:CR=1 FL=1
MMPSDSRDYDRERDAKVDTDCGPDLSRRPWAAEVPSLENSHKHVSRRPLACTYSFAHFRVLWDFIRMRMAWLTGSDGPDHLCCAGGRAYCETGHTARDKELVSDRLSPLAPLR